MRLLSLILISYLCSFTLCFSQNDSLISESLHFLIEPLEEDQDTLKITINRGLDYRFNLQRVSNIHFTLQGDEDINTQIFVQTSRKFVSTFWEEKKYKTRKIGITFNTIADLVFKENNLKESYGNFNVDYDSKTINVTSPVKDNREDTTSVVMRVSYHWFGDYIVQTMTFFPADKDNSVVTKNYAAIRSILLEKYD